MLEEQNIRVKKLRFSSINGLKSCLKQGVGFTICPQVAIQKELAEGSLSMFAWQEDQYETSIIMIWHMEKWCSPLLKDFMNLSQQLISA